MMPKKKNARMQPTPDATEHVYNEIEFAVGKARPGRMVDPALIMALFSAISSMVESCGANRSTSEVAGAMRGTNAAVSQRRRRILLERSVRRELRDRGLRYRKEGGDGLVDLLLTKGEASSPEELAAFIDEHLADTA